MNMREQSFQALPAKSVFVEQSAWMAFMNPEDPFYLQARSMFFELHDLERPLSTTNSVLFETHQWLRDEFDYADAQMFLNTVDKAVQQSALTLIPGSPELEQEARRLLLEYPDCRFSLNEALNAVVVLHHGMKRVFTFNSNYAFLSRIDRDIKVLPSL
ncbi:type II toxin-antitoxin system VapC family toxin [Paenibacillus hodogayensis]|uniref:Type II toxin-antitoxin system VapC family toxin n=1 Tax=Paenibacillus hodogayensis TaxID=279208 RepID=A0ABV5W221_9BACL